MTFTLLAAHHHGRPPDWPTDILLGISGLAGGYVGARLQHQLPEAAIRRSPGVVVVVVGEYPLITGSVSPIGHVAGTRGSMWHWAILVPAIGSILLTDIRCSRATTG